VTAVALVPLTGGLDSTVVAAQAASAYGPGNVRALYVDYGHRARRMEQVASREVAGMLRIGFDTVRVRGFARAAGVDTKRDPASFAEAFVPNRDAFLADVALAFALARGIRRVHLGVTGGDAYGATDPWWLTAMNEANKRGNVDCVPDAVYAAPLQRMSKKDVVVLGQSLGAPFASTWTCWGTRRPVCRECPKCQARTAAFEDAGVDDPQHPDNRARWNTMPFHPLGW